MSCASHTRYPMLRLGTAFILTVILPVLLNVAEWNSVQFDLAEFSLQFFELALEMSVPEVHIQQSFAFIKRKKGNPCDTSD